jgi:ferric enterobactin receptor
MRLVVMARYLSVKGRNSTILCLTILSFIFTTGLYAQTYKSDFQNIPLSDALVSASKQFNIKVAFDSEKLRSVTINRQVNGNTTDEFMTDLLLNTGFKFEYRYNRYLIVGNDIEKKGLPAPECQIMGSISDKETGEQLPYASVILINKSLSASASENGSFCIKNISSNPVHLMVSYIGYDPMDTTVNWTDPSLNINIRLNRKINMLDTVVVRGNRLEMVNLRNDVDFATTIDPSRLIDLPVLAETDIFRMLQLLPGISYTENSAGLSIRGGSSDQNLVLYDGQTLYNLSHYYGVISALNPNVIKDLQIYKGGYDSRFGERVSGIVDITGKSGNQVKPTVYGDLNLLSGNITTEIPINKKLTIVAALRRSYSDIYSTGFSKNLFDRNISSFSLDPNAIINFTKPSFWFYDYNAKLTYRTSNVENFSLSLYGGKDHFTNSYSGTSHDLIVATDDRNVWSNYGVSGTWLRQWNESFFSNLQIGASGYTNNSSNSTIIDRTLQTNNNHALLPDSINVFNTYNQNELKDLYLSMRNTFKISNNNQLNFGLLIRENSILYHKDADQVYIYDNMEQSAWTSSIYFQDRITLFTNLTVKPGFRLSYYSGNGKLFLEPRFSVNYKFSDGFSVRMATGRYNQFISQVLAQQETGYNKNFWVLADDSIHPEVASNHFIFGFTAESGKFLFDAEVYYKTYSGLQEYIFISQFLRNKDFPNYFPPVGQNNQAQLQPSYYVTGGGRSYGIDFLLKYQSRNFTSWVSYSMGRSLQHYNRINNNSDIPSPSDQPNQFSWTNMLTSGNWNFGTVTLFSSGKPYIYSSKSNQKQNLIRVYQRLPDYFRSDLSVNYNFSVRKAKFKTGATILNLFNTQNYFDINTRKFDFDNTSFTETTLIQSQSLSVNLFVHFIF